MIHNSMGGGDQMTISVWRHQKNQSGVLLDVGVHFTRISSNTTSAPSEPSTPRPACTNRFGYNPGRGAGKGVSLEQPRRRLRQVAEGDAGAV